MLYWLDDTYLQSPVGGYTSVDSSSNYSNGTTVNGMDETDYKSASGHDVYYTYSIGESVETFTDTTPPITHTWVASVSNDYVSSKSNSTEKNATGSSQSGGTTTSTYGTDAPTDSRLPVNQTTTTKGIGTDTSTALSNYGYNSYTTTNVPVTVNVVGTHTQSYSYGCIVGSTSYATTSTDKDTYTTTTASRGVTYTSTTWITRATSSADLTTLTDDFETGPAMRGTVFSAGSGNIGWIYTAKWTDCSDSVGTIFRPDEYGTTFDSQYTLIPDDPVAVSMVVVSSIATVQKVDAGRDYPTTTISYQATNTIFTTAIDANYAPPTTKAWDRTFTTYSLSTFALNTTLSSGVTLHLSNPKMSTVHYDNTVTTVAPVYILSSFVDLTTTTIQVVEKTFWYEDYASMDSMIGDSNKLESVATSFEDNYQVALVVIPPQGIAVWRQDYRQGIMLPTGIEEFSPVYKALSAATQINLTENFANVRGQVDVDKVLVGQGTFTRLEGAGNYGNTFAATLVKDAWKSGTNTTTGTGTATSTIASTWLGVWCSKYLVTMMPNTKDWYHPYTSTNSSNTDIISHSSSYSETIGTLSAMPESLKYVTDGFNNTFNGESYTYNICYTTEITSASMSPDTDYPYPIIYATTVMAVDRLSLDCVTTMYLGSPDKSDGEYYLSVPRGVYRTTNGTDSGYTTYSENTFMTLDADSPIAIEGVLGLLFTENDWIYAGNFQYMTLEFARNPNP